MVEHCSAMRSDYVFVGFMSQIISFFLASQMDDRFHFENYVMAYNISYNRFKRKNYILNLKVKLSSKSCSL